MIHWKKITTREINHQEPTLIIQVGILFLPGTDTGYRDRPGYQNLHHIMIAKYNFKEMKFPAGGYIIKLLPWLYFGKATLDSKTKPTSISSFVCPTLYTDLID